MTIDYIIIEQSSNKKKLKDSFQDFFLEVFEKPLSNDAWQHQIINSPYESSSLILAKHNEKIVSSALMIPQKLICKGKVIDYYLFTTSAILKNYRKHGIYIKLLEIQRELCTKNQKACIIAFPNKLAYPILKLFGRFKDLRTTNLVSAKVSDIDLKHTNYSFPLDKPMINWRFEHKEYDFYIYKGHVLVAKMFNGSINILAVYDKKHLKGLDLTFGNMDESLVVVTLECFLKSSAKYNVLEPLCASYYPINKKLDYSKININLLMSDVF